MPPNTHLVSVSAGKLNLFKHNKVVMLTEKVLAADLCPESLMNKWAGIAVVATRSLSKRSCDWKTSLVSARAG